jgi:hypothetical protein
VGSEFSTAVLDDARAGDERRVLALEDLGILGIDSGDRFDRITRLAQQVFGVAAAAVTLVDRTTQHHKSQAGSMWLGDGPRELAFCDHTIRRAETMVVEDAAVDERFATNPSVTGGPRIRFYAGHPIEAPGGHRVGALCLVDDRPRRFSEADQAMLAEFASWAQREVVRAEELERAALVQRSLMPRTTPELRGYDIAGFCQPSGTVGGDFFDWYSGPDGTVVFTLGDVMGKGMQAAIIMATVRAVMRSTGRTARPSAAVREAAQILYDDLQQTDTLITLCQARLCPQEGMVTLTDAGHGLVLVVRADGTAEPRLPSGLPLGWGSDEEWPEAEIRLAPGDTVVAFSDGLLDIYDGTLDALRQVALVVARSARAQDVVDHYREIALAVPVLPDDVTVVAIRREG